MCLPQLHSDRLSASCLFLIAHVTLPTDAHNGGHLVLQVSEFHEIIKSVLTQTCSWGTLQTHTDGTISRGQNEMDNALSRCA